MNFKTNFNKISLLGNKLIKIYFDDKTIEFVPPSVESYLTDYDFIEFMFLMKLTPEEFSKSFNNQIFVIKNSYEVFMTLLKIDYKKESLLNYFKKIFPNIDYLNSHLECDGKDINSDEYNLLIDFLLVSCAEKDFNDFMAKIDFSYQTKNKELTPLQKKKLEQEKKLEEIKNKKKQKNKGSESKDAITIDQIIIAVLYEFPGLTLQEIYNMNMITLIEFWKYVSKVLDTQIQIVAAGNGLVKEFTYFIH